MALSINASQSVHADRDSTDESDRQGAMQRTRTLRDIGIDEIVRSLRDDPDIDVRERVRVAVRQLDSL